MNDLISRQAAIDAIRASTSKYTGFMEMEMYTDDDAVEAINGVPSAQQWIPVSERLPEENGRYLTTCNRWGGWTVDWNIWHTTPKPGWLWEQRVSAWMPLPEPWKGEE